MKRMIRKFYLLGASTASLLPQIQLDAATLTEPSVVVFGQVVHIGEGSSYQLSSGTLTFEIVKDSDPDHLIELTTSLNSIGPSGELSYRLEIPTGHQLETFETSDLLSVGFSDLGYSLQSIKVNGETGYLIDPAHSNFSISFADRALEHRLDIEVNLPETDTDGDDIPDWWEENFGFNIYLASDASNDGDGDGLTNLEEFENGTNPTVSNKVPTILSTTMTVPYAGISGFYIKVIDSDSEPEALSISLDSIPEGLNMRSETLTLVDGATVSYQDILNGEILIDVGESFESGSLEMTVSDDTSSIPATVVVTIHTPANARGFSPSIWLDASQLSTTSVEEWTDLSGNLRDAYQPIPDWQPSFDSETDEISFAQDRFLFLDDRSFDASEFTGFIVFKAELSEERQTLLRMDQLDLSIGGSDDPHFATSFHLTGAGREFRGPLLENAVTQQITIGGDNDSSYLERAQGRLIPDQTAADSNLIPASFSTIGASRTIQTTGAGDHFLSGSIQEILIYPTNLEPEVRAQNEDYQRSRWSGYTIWDFRDQITSVQITGNPHTLNVCSGGWAADTLIGGPLHDIIRGGPNNDLLTGSEGGDRFQIFSQDGDDTITDYAPEEGDTIDLASIFANTSGDPDDYIQIRIEIAHVDGALPRVDSVIELDHDGPDDGWNVDQSITLQDQAFGSNHLPELVGEGSILLGNLAYEASFTFETVPSEIFENGNTYTVTLGRAGNLDAALDVPLSFTGSAELDDDYTTLSTTGETTTRSVRFERGEEFASFEIIPEVDLETESETILITILDDPNITSGAGTSASISLLEAIPFTIQTQQHVEIGSSEQSGIVIITRHAPDLSNPATIGLEFGGSLNNGEGFAALPTTLEFEADEASKSLSIVPESSPTPGPDIEHLMVTLVAQEDDQLLGAPESATVLFLPSDSVYQSDLSTWLATQFSGSTDLQIANIDHEPDNIFTIFEYIIGLDPNSVDPATMGMPVLNVDDSTIQIELITSIGWSGVELKIEGSSDLSTWDDVTERFTVDYSLEANDKMKSTWTSPRSEMNYSFFRLSAEALPTAP